MRFFTILTALLVAGFLYALVFERETLLSFASGEDIAQESAEEVQTVPADDALVSVVALRSSAQPVDSAVILRGRTEAARQVDVQAETSGLVISDPLRKGTYVEAGQLLCVLDPGTRAASLSEAEARLAEARINFRATDQLSESGFASETRAASARATLQAAEAGVETVKKEIERLEVRAPFAGLLESDTAELGSLMQPGALCATVIQLDPIKLVGFAPETEVDRILLGARAGARLASGREVAGQVTFLSRSADELTRTFRVEVEVANDDHAIRDGQTAEILISAEGKTAHLLPQSSMTLDDAGRLGVRIVAEGDRASFVPATLVRDSADGVWLSGLPDEVAVIISGQEYVTDGVRMDVTYREVSR